MLSDSNGERYSRQLAIDGFGPEAQEKLANARVFIAGAGGLGCSIALYLAVAGVGYLGIVDNGRIELSNLNRQILYAEEDIGKGKASVIAQSLSRINPMVEVESKNVELTAENAHALIGDCSLIIDALDNFPSRFILNKAAIERGLPVVHGAVNSFSGQMMTVFPGKSACLVCLYRDAVQKGITPVIGTASGLIGTLQATEAIKLITGRGTVIPGRLLFFDGIQMKFVELEIPRDPACPHCGDRAMAKP